MMVVWLHTVSRQAAKSRPGGRTYKITVARQTDQQIKKPGLWEGRATVGFWGLVISRNALASGFEPWASAQRLMLRLPNLKLACTLLEWSST